MVQLKWWIKDNKVEVITVTGIVIALIIVLITLIYQMNKFEIECRASGGHVESTFLYMQYIPHPPHRMGRLLFSRKNLTHGVKGWENKDMSKRTFHLTVNGQSLTFSESDNGDTWQISDYTRAGVKVGTIGYGGYESGRVHQASTRTIANMAERFVQQNG